MRSKAPIISVLLFLATIVELYTYNGIEPFLDQIENNYYYWLTYYFLIFLSVSSIFVFVNNTVNQRAGEIRKASSNIFGGLALTLILTKVAFNSALFAEDMYRLVSLGIGYLNSLIYHSEESIMLASRSSEMTQVGLGLATIPFISFVHGITIGKYKFKIKRVKLAFSDLPAEFNGYRILQFSDMHSGTFDSIESVKKGIDKMKNENADLILFTGDMVNNLADEVKPFIPMLKELNAKDGKYSILGNHDYGDYIRWASSEDKINNVYRLINYQQEADFSLLMNENIRIIRNGQSIRLAGVENWGKPPFPQHGDLNKALEGIDDQEFTILMSHDPSHWDSEVIHSSKKVHITLSGHTHGMQFGFDIPGIKWSPVKYKYPRWSGLYEEMGRYLYVNNGFGFLGFPGRVGIYPEITILELTKEKNS